jgi:hypothetical protein
MVTSVYQADVAVEVAFDGGFRVPMTDWTWTDVSAYVDLEELINIVWGRGDEKSAADANTLSLTLDNSDGRFTAGLTTGAYYPDVVLYKPIRVTADPVDGAIRTIFTGYITSWPVEWNGTSAYARASITASSRLSRLGLNAAWRSLVEETYLADAPVVYYPLGEPEGSTLAADVSGNGAAPLSMVGAGTAVVFGQATGPGTDDLTAATFANGKYLRGTVATSTPGAIAVECWFSTSSIPSGTDDEPILVSCGNLSINQARVDGYIRAEVPGNSAADLVNVSDGATHHAAATWDGTTLRLYVDGVEVDNTAVAGTPTLGEIVVGGLAGGSATFNGVVAHAAVYGSASVLSAARVAAHAEAGSTGSAGELTSARLERYAEMAGIPAAEVDAETGVASMSHVDTTGGQVVDLMRMCETTEGGVLFDALDGTLTMHNRTHRYDAASLFTLDMAQGEVESDYSPRMDASMLVNDVTITSSVASAHIKDDASIEANGIATASVTIADTDDDAPLQYASWAVYVFKDPKIRTPTLSVDALAQVGKTPNCSAVLAATIGDKVTVSNHPDQAQASTVDYFIEGGTYAIGPESFVVTWNVTPSSPDDLTLIVSDATRGVVGTNVVAF